MSADLVSTLGNGPSGACSGMFGGLQEILTGLTKSTDSPSRPPNVPQTRVLWPLFGGTCRVYLREVGWSWYRPSISPARVESNYCFTV